VHTLAAAWGLRLESDAPLLGDTSTNLRVTVHDAKSNKRSVAHVVAKLPGSKLSLLPPKPADGVQPGMQGWVRSEVIEVPDEIEQVGAVTIEKVNPAGDGSELVDYIGNIRLTRYVKDGRKSAAQHHKQRLQMVERTCNACKNCLSPANATRTQPFQW
jgi:hypothetical protein